MTTVLLGGCLGGSVVGKDVLSPSSNLGPEPLGWVGGQHAPCRGWVHWTGGQGSGIVEWGASFLWWAFLGVLPFPSLLLLATCTLANPSMLGLYIQLVFTLAQLTPLSLAIYFTDRSISTNLALECVGVIWCCGQNWNSILLLIHKLD